MTTIIKRNKWEIWRDVIFALFIRELRVGFNDKLGLSWSIINPVVFIFMLSVFRGVISGPEVHTIPTFTFMAIGLLMIQSFMNTLNSTARSIAKNRALFAFRQVQPISPVLASALFELLNKIFVTTSIIVMMYFLGMELTINDPLLLLGCFVTLWLFSVSLGLFFGISELFIQEIAKARELLTRPLFFISGTFFSLQDLPKEYWYALDWNPILHAVELSRYSVYPTYGKEGVSFEYLIVTSFFIGFFAIAFYFAYWKKAISR